MTGDVTNLSLTKDYFERSESIVLLECIGIRLHVGVSKCSVHNATIEESDKLRNHKKRYVTYVTLNIQM